jgi:DNA (cytosine-5)-methyltransferase 1
MTKASRKKSSIAPVRNAGTSSLPDFVHESLTVKNPPDFTVVSTFSDCGGSSTGYVWAGGKVLLAVEWDDNAVETYQMNYPDTPIYHGDIANLTVDEALRLTGLKPGELDILDGSPPCQGFSTAGRRMIDDPRNQLFREYVRLLRGLQPKVFVMENVSGMVKGKMKLVFAEILRELKASGYVVSARLMNAMYFGVPQSRERLIFIGVREDLGTAPTHPHGTIRPVGFRHAIAGCAGSPALRHSERIARYWSQLKPGQCIADLDPKGNGFNAVKVNPDRVCPTITKGWTAGIGLMHPFEVRFLSDSEILRLASFPDGYRMAGDSSKVVQRIGNTVPPRFMQAIAEHIRDHMLKVADDGRTP